MVRLLLIASLLIAVIPACAEKVTLATGGEPAATIVVPADANPRVKDAAADLQRYVKLICDVTLPIQTDGKAVAGTGLYIDNCEPTTDADLPEEGLNPETYAIRVRDGSVFFTGRNPTPVSFAVSSFIEDVLGVRWFAPGELWEYIPPGTQGELVVEVQDRVTVPGTSPRLWSGHDWGDSWKKWNRRNKTVVSEVVPRRQFQNNVYRVFPASKYAETHPEYYPLIGGKRWTPSTDSDRYWRPCESSPEVQRLVVEYARNWFDARPDIDSFSVGMDDISHMCSCDNCRAMDPRPDSYEKREFSDRHYKFVNAIAKEIKKTHPDRYIGTLIYNIARELPETVPELEDNVFGFITETSALWWQEGRKEADHELSRQWAKRCKHLSRYDYYGMGTFIPRVYPHAMAEQIKFDKSLGFEGMYIEVYTFLPHTAPMIWACAKLQWDHTLDIDDLLGEFYTKMYGPAAPVMKEYFDLLEASWNTPRPGRKGWVHRNIVNQALSIDPETVDKGLELLQRAINSTGDPDIQARVDIHRAALRFAAYPVKALATANLISQTPVTDADSAAKVLVLVDRMSTVSAAWKSTVQECHDRQDLLGANIRGLGDLKGYLQLGKVAQLERGAFVGAMNALAWYSENDPDAFARLATKLTSQEAGSLGDTVKAWLWVQENDPPNLLENGDFEEAGQNLDEPEKDWVTEGAPRRWSTWTSSPAAQFSVVGGVGKRDSAAASISNGASTCYIQSHGVKAGEKYLCVGWAKGDPATSTCGGQFGIRYRDEKGAWHPRRDLEPSVRVAEGTEGWQPLVLFAEIPEGTGSLLVMPGAKSQDEGARVLFDDIALYRIE